MEVRFWGVRGSIPVPGRETNRYGGNTSCVQVTLPNEPVIVVDGGSGLRNLGQSLVKQSTSSESHILISHTHWDHIQGLPFYSPLHRPSDDVHIYARGRNDGPLRSVFADTSAFPMQLSDVKAKVDFHEVNESQHFAIGRVHVTCAKLNHPWVAIAYRIEKDGVAMVYASDTAPFRDILFQDEYMGEPPKKGLALDPQVKQTLSKMRADLIDLCRGADLLIYDTQFTNQEYSEKPHWGHSTPDDAIAIAQDANVKQLAFYHHAPHRSDDAQDAILVEYRKKYPLLPIIGAFEGLTLVLGPVS